MDLYTKLTSTINDLFTSQLSGSISWKEVPGQLVRVSSSPAGYTWGLNAANSMYICKEPCTGAWTSTTPPGKILDITTDSSRVYALSDGGTRVVYTHAVNGSGGWSSPISAPSDSKTLVATSSDIFVDTDRGIFKCRSPCALPSWTPTVSDSIKLDGKLGTFQMTGDTSGNLKGNPNKPILSAMYTPRGINVKPTSASARFAYGVDSNKAQIFRNGEWHPIPGLSAYSVSSVSGEIDDTAIYATTTDGIVLRCAAPCASQADVSKIGTPGMSPDPTQVKQVSVNPQSKKVWMLSSTLHSGSGGAGIYNRTDEVPVDVNTTLLPLDAKRNNVLLDIKAQYDRADAAATVGDQLVKTQQMVHDSRPRTPPEEDPRILRRKLDFMDVRKSIILLQIACGTVFAVLIVLLILPPPISTILSFIVGCVGAMLVVSFSTS